MPAVASKQKGKTKTPAVDKTPMKPVVAEPPYSERWSRRGQNLMISISGVRGVVPDGLDPVNIVHFTRAFAAITGKTIVIGNDARPTADMFRKLVIGTLIASGKKILDVGLAPTPTVKAVVRMFEADAGIMLSASHNPPNWNAFKFITKGGFFFNQKESNDLLKALHAEKSSFVNYAKIGNVKKVDGVQLHIESVLKLIPNLDEVRAHHYKVVVDAVAGAGREALPMLLREMGCEVIPLYCDPDPHNAFPRPPEPTPAALEEFGALVKSESAAVGFALDPDADRLVVGSPEEGTFNEEFTVPLALMALLNDPAMKELPIVVNLSTSNVTDVVAHNLGASVLRAPVGEANVVEMMIKEKAMFGGEGNGGVIHAGCPSFGRDALVGAALILSAMASHQTRTIDKLMESLPTLYIEKAQRDIGGASLDKVYSHLKRIFKDAVCDERDGLHLTNPDGSWIHARLSNTEPIMRIIAQAGNERDLKRMIQSAKGH